MKKTVKLFTISENSDGLITVKNKGFTDIELIGLLRFYETQTQILIMEKQKSITK